MDTNNIGKRMYLYRMKTGTTQRACAEAAGITIQTWYQIEKEYQKPKLPTAVKIERVISKVVPAPETEDEA